MSERNGTRYGLLGLAIVILLAILLLLAKRANAPTDAAAAPASYRCGRRLLPSCSTWRGALASW